jgi:hypothetical protein
MPSDAADLRAALRAACAENLAHRDELTAVAKDLERLAGEGDGRGVLLARAMLIRRRLWESKRELG